MSDVGDEGVCSEPPLSEPMCPEGVPLINLTLNMPFSGDNSASLRSDQGGCGGGGPADIYSFVAPSTGSFQFSAEAQVSGVDLLMYARSDCLGVNEGSELACNDNIATTNRDSAFTLSLTQGEVIYLVIDSYSGSNAGAYTLTATAAP